jgi:hypothetical protein
MRWREKRRDGGQVVKKAGETRDKREAVEQGKKAFQLASESKHWVMMEGGGEESKFGDRGAAPSRSGFQCRGRGRDDQRGERHAARYGRGAQVAAGFRTVIADYRREAFENSRENRCQRRDEPTQQRSRDRANVFVLSTVCWSSLEPPRDMRLASCPATRTHDWLGAGAQLRNATLHSSAQAGGRPTRVSSRRQLESACRPWWKLKTLACSSCLFSSRFLGTLFVSFSLPDGGRCWRPLHNICVAHAVALLHLPLGLLRTLANGKKRGRPVASSCVARGCADAKIDAPTRAPPGALLVDSRRVSCPASPRITPEAARQVLLTSCGHGRSRSRSRRSCAKRIGRGCIGRVAGGRHRSVHCHRHLPSYRPCQV